MEDATSCPRDLECCLGKTAQVLRLGNALEDVRQPVGRSRPIARGGVWTQGLSYL